MVVLLLILGLIIQVCTLAHVVEIKAELQRLKSAQTPSLYEQLMSAQNTFSGHD